MTQPMISQPQPAEPAPINPTITAGLLVGAFAKLDTLESSPRALHNFLQDDFLPIVRRMHEELTTTMHFVGMHEDRIGALEDGEGGGLHPEDAEQLLEFLTKAVEVFKSLQRETKIPNLASLIQEGEDCVKLVKELSEDEEEAPPAAGR